MRAFLLLRGSRARLFSDLSAGESCPLRIVPQEGPAVSPTDKPRKDGALYQSLQTSPHIPSNNQMGKHVITNIYFAVTGQNRV
jgi:hypothetical protein